MAQAANVFIVILIVVAIVIIILVAIHFNRQNFQPQPQPQPTPGPSPQPNSSGWGPQVGVSGQRGFCNVYTFQATNPSVPAAGTLDTQVLDGLEPVRLGRVNCVDVDQIAARKVRQTCQGNSVLGNFCLAGNGQKFNPGETEELYVQCQASMCQDTLATVALNFDPAEFTTQTACLQADPTSPNSSIVSAVCDLTADGQLFRVDRIDPDGTADPSGPFGRIMDRQTGLCVVPDSPNPTAGDNLILGRCEPAQGYVWWFFPPQNVVTTGETPPIPIPASTAPQQLIYFPNRGNNPPTDLVQFIINRNPVSMMAPIDNDGNVIFNQPITLQDMALNISQLGYNAQTIDYWLYQLISMTGINPDNGTNFPFYQANTTQTQLEFQAL